MFSAHLNLLIVWVLLWEALAAARWAGAFGPSLQGDAGFGSPRPVLNTFCVSWITLLFCNETSMCVQYCCREGRMNPSRWRLRRFLPVSCTFLSTSLRKTSLSLLSLRFWQPVSAMLLFGKFKTHSLIQFTRSLTQFDMMALRNFGLACFSKWRVW